MEEAQNFRPQLSDFRPLNSLEEMKETLKNEMPFFVDINFAPYAYGREPAATGKVGKPPQLEAEFCDHTIFIVGFNDETEELIFQNSWGTGSYRFQSCIGLDRAPKEGESTLRLDETNAII
jgi:hypothetical protein